MYFELLFKEKIIFKSHSIKSNHRALRKNKVDTYRAPVLHVIIVLLFKQPNCVLTPISILSIIDFYDKN